MTPRVHLPWYGERPRLIDALGRPHTYLRLSVTDRCDLACVYCRDPSADPVHARRHEMLTFEEIVRIVGVMSDLGVRRVRLTGGEPLARKDVVDLVAGLARLGTVELAMTTNGTRLAELARALREAGLGSINVSLDSLDPIRFARITCGGDLSVVLRGIDAAISEGLEVKLNTVPVRGHNDEELGAIVDWAWGRGIVPRFIELMPAGAGARLGAEARVPTAEVIARLGWRVTGVEGVARAHRGPARYLRSVDGAHVVGLISALTRRFCASCNRLRLTAAGRLHPCVARSGAVSVRDVLRAGGSRAELARAVVAAVAAKEEGHAWTGCGPSDSVDMCSIGG